MWLEVWGNEGENMTDHALKFINKNDRLVIFGQKRLLKDQTTFQRGF